MIRKRKSEDNSIDCAAEEILKILKAGVEPIESEELAEEEESETFTEDEPQDVPMPKLSQTTYDLGSSEKEKKEMIPEAQKERREEKSEKTHPFKAIEQLCAQGHALIDSNS